MKPLFTQDTIEQVAKVSSRHAKNLRQINEAAVHMQCSAQQMERWKHLVEVCRGQEERLLQRSDRTDAQAAVNHFVQTILYDELRWYDDVEMHTTPSMQLQRYLSI